MRLRFPAPELWWPPVSTGAQAHTLSRPRSGPTPPLFGGRPGPGSFPACSTRGSWAGAQGVIVSRGHREALPWPPVESWDYVLPLAFIPHFVLLPFHIPPQPPSPCQKINLKNHSGSFCLICACVQFCFPLLCTKYLKCAFPVLHFFFFLP